MKYLNKLIFNRAIPTYMSPNLYYIKSYNVDKDLVLRYSYIYQGVFKLQPSYALKVVYQFS